MNEVLTKLAKYSTPQISDVLDMLGIVGGLEKIHPVSSNKKCIGYAYTIEFDIASSNEAAPAADYIDGVPEDSIIVLNNHGRTNCTVWGDILSYLAIKKGINGTVINGLCRDLDSINEMGYSIFTLGAYMKSGKNRVKMVKKNQPTQIGDTNVIPGDIVVADGSGVLVIPQKVDIKLLIEKIEELDAIEKEIIRDLDAGISLVESRRNRKYNNFSYTKS